MNPLVLEIFDRHYPKGHPARKILVQHSRRVAQKALEAALQVAEEGPDFDFIAEAAFLHDIGIGKTHAPDIGCHGEHPYICHGFLGREILEQEGLFKHALACERHTGTGLGKEDILKEKLPLPLRDMRPLSLEEEIICYADKFFSKNPGDAGKEKPLLKIRKELAGFGADQVARFDAWHHRFGESFRKEPQGDSEGWQEFKLIEKLRSRKKDPRILVGSGDDAALLASLQKPVISTDSHREGVHFLKSWMSHEALGYKATMAAASDLAASFAQPIALFINLGLPASEREEDILALQRGIQKALQETGGSIAGGNICKAEVLCIDLFFVGEGGPVFPRRSLAREGEGLYVTGFLGDAAAGCQAFLMGRERSHPFLAEKFCSPKARFDAAALLSATGVSCVMDISDGLAGDARHIAKASGISVAIETATLPLSSELLSYCRQYAEDPLRFALTGGEDYELLFCTTAALAQTLEAHLPHMRRIGCCLESSKDLVTGLPPWAVSGFCHGKT